MALQVWLPLNGNINNQGVSDLKFSILGNNNTLTNSSGKTGSCYDNNSYSGGGLKSDKTISLGQKQSMFCWVNFTNLVINGSNLGGSLVTQHRYANNAGMGLTIKKVSSTTGYLSVNTGNGSSRTYNSYCSTTLMQAGQWYHVGYTYDGSNIRLYVNGVLENTVAFTGMYVPADYIAVFAWSLNSSTSDGVHGDYKLNGRLNDVRIYDHCLSKEEVKEISKGLVLHYKLDENYQVMNNAFAYPTFNTSSASGGWNHWPYTNNTGSYAQNTDRTYIYSPNQTYSHRISHTSGANYYICYQSPAFEGGYRSAQAIVKMSDESSPVGNVWLSHNANVGTNPPLQFIALRDNFWLIKHEGFRQDGSNDLVSIGVQNLKTVYVSEFYLENDRTVCSDILWSNDIVTDVSGYKHNGTITGSLEAKNNSCRYVTSAQFGNGNYISPTLFPSFLTNEVTVSMWVKLDQLPASSPGRTMIYTAWYGFSCEITSGGKTYFRTNLSSGSVDSPQGTIAVGSWVHWVGVKNSTGVSLYLNGTLVGTTSNSNNFNWSSNVSNRIGCYSGSYFLYGQLSDVRLYSTALSEDDIKDLYHTSAKIDNNGNLSCYEFDERGTAPQIGKNGVVETGLLVEGQPNKFKVLSDGSIWVQLLHHNNPASNLFTASNCWNYDNGTNLYSALFLLKNGDFKNSQGQYEFLACEKLTSASTETVFRWKQTSNPSVSSTITGFSAISGSSSYNYRGLLTNGNYGCMHNGSTWWGCCGSYTPYQGGIPGFGNVITTGYLDLYVRVSNEKLKGSNISGTTAFYKESILTNQLLEY